MSALHDAEDQFCRIRTTNIPTWLRYFDQAYLSAKFGHTLRDLGNPGDAERFARQSLHMTDGYERGRIFNLALLAGVLADNGDLEESVVIAQEALRMTEQVRSTRALAYMTDVANRLVQFRNDNRAQALYKKMAAQRVPVARFS